MNKFLRILYFIMIFSFIINCFSFILYLFYGYFSIFYFITSLIGALYIGLKTKDLERD